MYVKFVDAFLSRFFFKFASRCLSLTLQAKLQIRGPCIGECLIKPKLSEWENKGINFQSNRLGTCFKFYVPVKFISLALFVKRFICFKSVRLQEKEKSSGRLFQHFHWCPTIRRLVLLDSLKLIVRRFITPFANSKLIVADKFSSLEPIILKN